MSEAIIIPYHDIKAMSNITVADLGVFTSAGGSDEASDAVEYCEIVDVTPSATCNIKVYTTNSFGESFLTEHQFPVPSGKLAIGDAMYYFSDASTKTWSSFLSSTNSLRSVENGLVVKIGFPGTFNTQIIIEEV